MSPSPSQHDSLRVPTELRVPNSPLSDPLFQTFSRGRRGDGVHCDYIRVLWKEDGIEVLIGSWRNGNRLWTRRGHCSVGNYGNRCKMRVDEGGLVTMEEENKF